jgi:hypothetical protein
MQILNYGGMAADSINNLSNALSMRNDRKAAEERAKQTQLARQQAAELFKSNASPDEIAAFSLQNPSIAEDISKQIAFKNDATRQNMTESMREILINPNGTEDVIQARAKLVAEQGGDPTQTLAELERYRADPKAYNQMIEKSYATLDPQGYQAYKSTLPKQADPMSEYQRASLALQRDQLNAQRQRGNQGSAATSNMKDYQYYQQLKQQDPQMAEEFAIKSGIKKVAPPKGMSAHGERTLTDAQDAAYSAFSSSDSLVNLADSYAANKEDLGGGLLGSANEAFKEFVGSEDKVTQMKKNYARVRNSQVIKSLPQGPATDKDIEIFSQGFPGENADPEYIESFLRGMAKAEYINGRFNEFKAGYISENNNTSGMMKAWKEEAQKLDGEIKEKFQSSTMDYSNMSDEDLFR